MFGYSYKTLFKIQCPLGKIGSSYFLSSPILLRLAFFFFFFSQHEMLTFKKLQILLLLGGKKQLLLNVLEGKLNCCIEIMIPNFKKIVEWYWEFLSINFYGRFPGKYAVRVGHPSKSECQK